MGSPRTRTASRRPARPSVVKYVPQVPGEPKLLHVLETRPVLDGDGNQPIDPQTGEPAVVQVTRGDRIVSYLKSNAPLHAAAAAAGVNKRTLTGWLAEAAEAQAKLEGIRAGTAKGVRLTNREKVLVEFKGRVDQAIAERHVQAAGKVTQLANGGITETVITEKVELIHKDDGSFAERLVERSTKTSTKGPSLPAALAILERRFDDDWSPTKKVHVTGTGGGTVLTAESVGIILDSVADKLAAKAASVAANAAATDVESDEADVVDAEVVDDGDAGTELEVAARPE